MNPIYEKLDTETEYEYGLRLIQIKNEDKPDDLSWDDIVKLLNLKCHKDSLRKATSVTEYSGYKVMQYFKEKGFSEDDYIKELENKKREVEKERIKLRTEKIEYNKMLRESSREELFVEKIIDSIKTNTTTAPPIKKIKVNDNERVGILNIADCHFGKEFEIFGLNGEVINKYSPDVFFSRMEKLFNEVIEYATKEKLTSFKIFNLGDALDGFLRNSQLLTMKIGVCDSAVVYGNYMGKWLNELSKHFNIEYYQTVGNHGELRLLDGKKGEHLHENIEIITGNIIKIINEKNPNFKYFDNKTGFIYTNILDYKILGIHGEVPNLKESIKDFSTVFNTSIDYIIAGHKHHSEYQNCGIRKGVISVGSIMGTDEYALSIKKISDATATFVIFENGKGKVDEHIFVLN